MDTGWTASRVGQVSLLQVEEGEENVWPSTLNQGSPILPILFQSPFLTTSDTVLAWTFQHTGLVWVRSDQEELVERAFCYDF